MGQVEQWRILAEEAAQEKDPDKLAEIIEALTRALDERDAKRNRNNQSEEAGRGLKDSPTDLGTQFPSRHSAGF